MQDNEITYFNYIKFVLLIGKLQQLNNECFFKKFDFNERWQKMYQDYVR